MNRHSLLYRIRGKLIRLIAPYLSSKLHLKLLFRHKLGYHLNLNNPKTFSEKLQWLKLNDIHPEYTRMVDKIEAKEYVASIIGEKYIIPTIGIYNNVDEIDFNKLPQQFVLKCTHDSGGIVVCKDKSKLDIEQTKNKLRKGWKKNYFKYNREYPYRDVRPRIIVEEYMKNEGCSELKDFKFFCFNGTPRFCQVIANRSVNETIDFYDEEWNHMDFIGLASDVHHSLIPHAKPIHYEKMLEIASILSANIPFVRIDLYDVNDNIYFGEITFFPASGLGKFTPNKWNIDLGNLIRLPLK